MAAAESNLLGTGGVQRTQCYTLGRSGVCQEVVGGWWGAICGPLRSLSFTKVRNHYHFHGYPL